MHYTSHFTREIQVGTNDSLINYNNNGHLCVEQLLYKLYTLLCCFIIPSAVAELPHWYSKALEGMNSYQVGGYSFTTPGLRETIMDKMLSLMAYMHRVGVEPMTL